MPSETATSWTHHAENALAAAGYRAGGARAAILRLLGKQTCCLSAHDIYEALQSGRRRVGVASVYRTLELLTNLKLVHRVDVGGIACYEPAHPTGDHHHHAICERCGEVETFADSKLEQALELLIERLQYRDSVHEIVVRGFCHRCCGDPVPT